MDFKSGRLKYCVITLGCKVNQYESEAVEKALEDKGHGSCDPRLIRGERLSRDEAPDVFVINTCTVTQKASMQSRQAIRRAVRANPDALVVVTGCYAQTRPEDIAEIPGVHFVAGHSEKGGIPELIESVHGEKIAFPRILRKDMSGRKLFEDMPATPSGSRTRAFLKIQDGCDAFCSYCIVPHARGRSRSMRPENVLEKIRELRRAGCNEVVLTGIHLGAWGKDLGVTGGLCELLSRIRDAGVPGRVRLSSIEPVELKPEIVELASKWEGLCPHFHIPLQSGDNDILKKMNRPYTREFFRDLVLSVREKLPDAAIGADCLIGFPGETESAFENTRRLIETLPVTYLHVFPFSPRRGTPAWRFSGRIPGPAVKKRCARMRRLGNVKKRRFFDTFVGRELEIVVEGQRDFSTGSLKAMSANYIPVLVNGPDELKNTKQTAKVTHVSEKLEVFGDISTDALHL